MSYNADIPQSTDQISQSQAQILANFQALEDIGANNLLPFLLLGPEQGSAPTTSATQMSLYEKTGTETSRPELAIRRPSDGTVSEFTAWGQRNDSAGGGDNGENKGGYAILPSGIIIKWGTWAMQSGATSQVVTFPTNTGNSGSPDINTGMKAFTTLFTVVPVVQYTVSATTFNNNIFWSISGANASNFTMNFSTSGTYTIRYFAVGV